MNGANISFVGKRAYTLAIKFVHFSGVNYKHNEAFCKAFGKHLRKLREDQGISLRELADRCEVEHSQIFRIENGLINTSISTVQALAEGLGLSHKDLFDFSFPDKKR